VLVEASARIAELERQVAERDQRIAADGARIATLEREVSELKELVNTLMSVVGRNSRNSHLPPSSDGPGARGGGSPSIPGKRPRGGQPGHRGAKRVLLPEAEVTNPVDLYPEVCESCWEPLPQCSHDAPKRYQSIDICGASLQVTEYRRHCVQCRCGFKTHAKVVGVIPSSPFGPGLMARVCALTGTYKLSRREAASLLHDFFNVTMSLGSISAIEKRVSAAIKKPVAEVQAHVNAAPVKHADATSWLHAGKLRSLWTIATGGASFYVVLPDGCADTIKPMFGVAAGILVSDRATVFSFWPMERRQICWAHLLRKFVAFAELKGAAKSFGQELIQAASLVFKYWNDFKAGKLDKVTFQNWMQPLRQQVEDTLSRAHGASIKDLSGSCENMLEHRAALWTFVDRDGVEPTNNHAERELRACVLWRRRSFGSQSEEGEKYAARIMTVVQTARKRGLNILMFLEQCCAAWLGNVAAPCLLTAR
jgi:transposase